MFLRSLLLLFDQTKINEEHFYNLMKKAIQKGIWKSELQWKGIVVFFNMYLGKLAAKDRVKDFDKSIFETLPDDKIKALPKQLTGREPEE